MTLVLFELNGIARTAFHRFTVAFGLSHRGSDLNKVALLREVAPMLQNVRVRSFTMLPELAP